MIFYCCRRQFLQSKVSQSLSDIGVKRVTDPYELQFSDSDLNVIPSQSNFTHHLHHSHSSSQQKSKAVGASGKPLGHQYKTKDMGSSSRRSSSQSESRHGLKRKRSGSSTSHSSLTSPPPAPTQQPHITAATSLTSPIAITIPPGLNIASLSNTAYNSNTISAQLVSTGKGVSTGGTQFQGQQQAVKAGSGNMNIVVSGVDHHHPHQPASIVNGQLLNLPGNITLDVLNNLTSGIERGQKVSGPGKGSLTAKLLPNHGRCSNKVMSLTSKSAQLLDSGVVTALPTGTVLMDNATAGTFLTSSQMALPPSNNSVSNSINNNHPTAMSNTTGIVFKKVSD